MAKRANRSKGFTPVRNKEMHAAMLELRRSSASSRHVVKSRKGTRAARRKAAMRDW